MTTSGTRGRGSKVERLPGHERFIRTLIINGKQTYIIADYMYWNAHVDEFTEWLEEHTEQGRDTQEGMTLSFATPQEEMWFMMRWG